MVPGWHSILSLCKRFGRGSSVIQELKRLNATDGFMLGVFFIFTGVPAWMCVRSIKWKKK